MKRHNNLLDNNNLDNNNLNKKQRNSQLSCSCYWYTIDGLQCFECINNKKKNLEKHLTPFILPKKNNYIKIKIKCNDNYDSKKYYIISRWENFNQTHWQSSFDDKRKDKSYFCSQINEKINIEPYEKSYPYKFNHVLESCKTINSENLYKTFILESNTKFNDNEHYYTVLEWKLYGSCLCDSKCYFGHCRYENWSQERLWTSIILNNNSEDIILNERYNTANISESSTSSQCSTYIDDTELLELHNPSSQSSNSLPERMSETYVRSPSPIPNHIFTYKSLPLQRNHEHIQQPCPGTPPCVFPRNHEHIQQPCPATPACVFPRNHEHIQQPCPATPACVFPRNHEHIQHPCPGTPPCVFPRNHEHIQQPCPGTPPCVFPRNHEHIQQPCPGTPSCVFPRNHEHIQQPCPGTPTPAYIPRNHEHIQQPCPGTPPCVFPRNHEHIQQPCPGTPPCVFPRNHEHIQRPCPGSPPYISNIYIVPRTPASCICPTTL